MRGSTAGTVAATFVRRLLAAERFASEKRLQRFGWRAFSSSDQDGMIAEIFRRIGISSPRFAEIGVRPRRGCNTAYLLACGWTGTWIAADAASRDALTREHQGAIREGRLRITPATADALDGNLLAREIGGADYDLLSVDAAGKEVDALRRTAPERARVVVVRYNASYRPPVRWLAACEPNSRSGDVREPGASLSALEVLMQSRGYALVGCNLGGSDAFFVRADVMSSYFEAPYTAETHFEPPRPYLGPALALVSGLGARAGAATVSVPDRPAAPTDELIHRATGQLNRGLFEESAFLSVTDIEHALRRAPPPSGLRSVLDFGCGCGRFARAFLPRCEGVRYVGADIDEQAIDWARTAFASATFVVNGHLPPLPFDAECFDVVLGWSVFTHLSEEYQDAWLAELQRVTVRGGTVLLTVAGHASWKALAEDSTHPLRNELLELRDQWLRDGILFWTLEGWDAYFPDFYHTTFHTPRYVKNHWSRWFDVIDIVPGGAGGSEDMVILRRPDR